MNNGFFLFSVICAKELTIFIENKVKVIFQFHFIAPMIVLDMSGEVHGESGSEILGGIGRKHVRRQRVHAAVNLLPFAVMPELQLRAIE